MRLTGGIILTLALALRLRGLETTGLWGDQAFTLNTAMRWVNGGPIPLAANKSSVGFVNPPMIEYLYAAALRLRPDILSVSWLTLIGGMAAVVVTGWTTARLFGRRAGLWAMLAFAVAPWAVFWSQLIWNQTMVPPFATLTLAGLLWYVTQEQRAVYLIGAFAGAAAMTQVHPGSAVQLLTIGLVLLLYRRRVRLSHLLAATAVFAALYIPYLLYQIGTGWADLRAMGDVAGQGAAFSPAAALLSLDLLHVQGLYRAIPQATRFDNLATLLFVASLILTVARGFLDRRAPVKESAGIQAEWDGIVIILLWFAMPVLFYLRASVYLQNYYLLSQWPAHFMILGIGLDTAQRVAERLAGQADTAARRRAWTVVGWLLPLPLLAVVVFQIGANLRYQDARLAGHGPALQVRHARRLIDAADRLLAERPDCRLVALGEGHQADNSNLALLQEFTDAGRVMPADGALAVPLPEPCAVYLDARPGSPASYWLAANARPIPEAAVAVGDQTWSFYDWTAPPAAEVSAATEWANGVALLGFHRGEIAPGEALPIGLTWAVVDDPAEEVYHTGVYLLGADDQVIAQQDGPGFDSIQWREGDRFITWFRLPVPTDLPAGSYRLAVAQYRWPDLTRVELTGGGNTAYLETVEIAP